MPGVLIGKILTEYADNKLKAKSVIHSFYRDLDHTASCDHVQNNEARKGFYKNLEKFYKRMYKQAKKRANNLDET